LSCPERDKLRFILRHATRCGGEAHPPYERPPSERLRMSGWLIGLFILALSSVIGGLVAANAKVS
jgi:hypothetical protein